MTMLDLPRAERFSLTVPGTPGQLVTEIVGGKQATCSDG
jgi:hypothetical protein